MGELKKPALFMMILHKKYTNLKPPNASLQVDQHCTPVQIVKKFQDATTFQSGTRERVFCCVCAAYWSMLGSF